MISNLRPLQLKAYNMLRIILQIIRRNWDYFLLVKVAQENQKLLKRLSILLENIMVKQMDYTDQ